MIYDPDDETTFASWMGAYASAFWSDYRQYWMRRADSSDSDDDEAAMLPLARAALVQMPDKLLASVQALRVERDAQDAVRQFWETLGLEDLLDEHRALTILQRAAGQPIVRDGVEIALGMELADIVLPRAIERWTVLAELLAVRAVTPRAAAYVARATRLYLFGLDAECVVMCRSVLEAALEQRLRDVLPLDRPAPALEELLRQAGETGVLHGYEPARSRRGWRSRAGSVLESADRLRRAGNHIVHEHPDSVGYPSDIRSAEEALRVVVRVLDALFPSDGPPSPRPE